MQQRNIVDKLLLALTDTPVVFFNGARQTGKSTLVKEIIKKKWPAHYQTLDNLALLAAAQSDPINFINQNETHIVIDEVQKVPDLFVAIKEAVDKDRKPGRFLLTGSANPLLLPQISESLAGRMEIITLWPFSQGELINNKEDFVKKVFSNNFPVKKIKSVSRKEIINAILKGGYPEALLRETVERRYDWFDAYTTAILQRDIREIANISDLTVFPKLLSLLATRSASLLNYAELSRSSGIPHTTLMRYLTLLQTTFLVCLIAPWSNHLGKRLVKTPKVYLCDTGLLSYLLGIDETHIEFDSQFMGILLENFVVMEIKKQLGWNAVGAQMFHYRTQTGQEVDIVLENRAGVCVGIEVKASTSINKNDFKGLIAFAENAGEKFLRGLVLYLGNDFLSFGPNLYAVPVNALWE